jgi:hypothetical protein
MHLNQNQCGSEKEKRRRLSRTLTSHIMQASYRLTWPICTTLSLPLKMAELSIITLKIHLPSTTGLLQIRSVMSINSKHRGNREIIAYVSIERKCQVVLSVLNAVHRTDFICSSGCHAEHLEQRALQTPYRGILVTNEDERGEISGNTK